MLIIEKLNQQIIEEYKNGNSEKRVILQTLKAALQKKKIDLGDKYDGNAEIGVLKSELKQRQEAKNLFSKGKREDLVKKADAEISILKEMLPEELSDDKITQAVQSVFGSTDDKSFGNLMKLSMGELKGQADGSRVAKIVNQILSI